MQTHRLQVVIPNNHEITLRFPKEVPTGPAEIIVLTPTVSDIQPASLASPEVLARWDRICDQLASDMRPFGELTQQEREARLLMVMGSGRGLFSSSDEVARRKREEVEIEESRFGH